MSLLTIEDDKPIAAGLSFPKTAFIEGHFRPANRVKRKDRDLLVLDFDGFDKSVAASILTTSVKRALHGARRLRPGADTVISFSKGDISTPCDAFNQSGFGGRDKCIHAHDPCKQAKTIRVDLADDADEAVV